MSLFDYNTNELLARERMAEMRTAARGRTTTSPKWEVVQEEPAHRDPRQPGRKHDAPVARGSPEHIQRGSAGPRPIGQRLNCTSTTLA